MQDIHQIIGITAGILAIGGYIPYIIGILKGKTKPSKATWLIWTVVGGLLAVSYLAEGDENAIWLPFGYFLGPLIIAIFSIRYGYSSWSWLDVLCLIIAGASIIPWLLSKNATSTLLINVLIDAAGALPTIVKTYHQPDSEDFTAWSVFFIASILELFAITNWNFAAIFPIYLFFLTATMVLLIWFGKNKNATKR